MNHVEKEMDFMKGCRNSISKFHLFLNIGEELLTKIGSYEGTVHKIYLVTALRCR